ncbi:uncharacterized protein [Miscanthus floridulus]|uniref:uncharacterized protein n=1 Tax=Miscanthus floridulus TaxID=154761 RepID=UPI00345A7FCB
MAPLLERMPELVEAYVRIDSYGDNKCSCGGCYQVMWPGHISDIDDDSNNEEDTEDYPGPNTQGCVLLEGLAQAKHLVLLAHHSRYIFRRDLRSCPTFSYLKDLVLNGYWCEPADCCALACILEHAPVLEKLTVLFSEKVELEYDIVLEGRPDATALSTMTTQCLKTVKVSTRSDRRLHRIDENTIT